MRCPYASCQHAEAKELAHAVWLCSACHRLSLECEDKNCRYLNRPFNRRCRNCRDDMLTEHWSGSAAQQWAAAGKFKRGCRPIDTGTPELVVDLSDRPRYAPPQRKVQLQFFEGLLALHYGGMCMALLHPFKSQEPAGSEKAAETPLWVDEDEVASPLHTRTFRPVRTPGDRYILFSTTRAVHGVDVWMLRDWAFEIDRPRRTLLDLTSESHVELAATPLLLSSHQLGLLLRVDRAYRWGVLDLNEPQHTNSTSDFLACSVELPIEGAPCQLEHVANRVVAFATPVEHWLWKSHDALAKATAGLQRSLQVNGVNTELSLDQHVLNDREFHFAKQKFLVDPSDQNFFDWYYETKDSEDVQLYRYRVYFDSLEAHDPVEIDANQKAVPIGPYHDATLEMLFAGRNRLLYEVGGVLQSPGGLGPIPDWTHLMGLTFEDPLLMAIGEHGRQIRMRSIYDSRETVIDAKQMYADPVIWSHWIFTCEIENERLLVYRRHLGNEPI